MNYDPTELFGSDFLSIGNCGRIVPASMIIEIKRDSHNYFLSRKGATDGSVPETLTFTGKSNYFVPHLEELFEDLGEYGYCVLPGENGTLIAEKR